MKVQLVEDTGAEPHTPQLPGQQSPLQELTMISEVEGPYLENEATKAGESQDKTAGNYHNSQPESHCDRKDREENKPQTDQHKVLLPTSEETDGNQRATSDKAQCDSVSVGNMVETSVIEFPAKKKSRLETCALTEKEPCCSLQTTSCENRPNGTDGMELQPSLLSPLDASVTAPQEETIPLQTRDCVDTSRAAAQVYMAATDGQSHERLLPDAGDSKSDSPAEEEELHPGCSPSKSHETEKKDQGNAAPQQVYIRATATCDKRGETRCEAGDAAGAPSADNQQGGLNRSFVDICKAVVPSGGSERKRRSGPDQMSGTEDAADPFGSGCLGYVSDSQLNSMEWIEDEEQSDRGCVSSDGDEDASELVCGLVRDLSSLNYTVMAAHRVLENLRCVSNSSRSSTR